MKQFVLTVAFAFLAHASFAGLSYDFESVTRGVRDTAISGSAHAEGNSFRMDIARGDGFTFRDKSFVVSHDGGKTLIVADPASKTYYQLDLSEASGGVAALFKQLGFLNFKISDPKVSSRNLGKGEVIAGYPTQRNAVDSSFDLTIGAGSHPMKIAISMATESWVTDRIAASLTNVLQKQSIATGIAQVDKMIAAQSAGVKGFPLRQVTKLRIVQNGKPMETVTTTSIRNIASKSFAASEFTIPANFKKTQSPIEKMMGAFK